MVMQLEIENSSCCPMQFSTTVLTSSWQTSKNGEALVQAANNKISKQSGSNIVVDLPMN